MIGDTLTKTVNKTNPAQQFCKGDLPASHDLLPGLTIWKIREAQTRCACCIQNPISFPSHVLGSSARVIQGVL